MTVHLSVYVVVCSLFVQGGQFVGSKINQEYMNGLCQSFSGMNMTPPDPMSCTQPTKVILKSLYILCRGPFGEGGGGGSRGLSSP